MQSYMDMIYPLEPQGPCDYDEYWEEYDNYSHYQNTYNDIHTQDTFDESDNDLEPIEDDEIAYKVAKKIAIKLKLEADT